LRGRTVVWGAPLEENLGTKWKENMFSGRQEFFMKERKNVGERGKRGGFEKEGRPIT